MIKPGESVGPYRIIEQLGQGGMATVYKAYHAALDRYVAIKVMHPAFKEDPGFLERFRREARIVAKLDHPHIVPVYDFSEHEGTPYLVMRYIEGKTLKARLQQDPVSKDEMLHIIKLAANALSYAHKEGVLHRDIKPSNIILTPGGGVFLTDFGLARIAQSGESTLSRDMMVGTPQYISPEQALGEELDARTDIYSLGVVLFEMATGRVPFSSDTPYSIIHDHIYSPLPLPSKINPDVSPEVERVILKAMAKGREDRYQDATELAAALEKALAETAVPPPLEKAAPTAFEEEKPKAATPPPQALPRRWWMWILIGSGITLMLCLCLFAFFTMMRKRHEATLATDIARLTASTPRQVITPPASQPRSQQAPPTPKDTPRVIPPISQAVAPPPASKLPPGVAPESPLGRAMLAVQENPDDAVAHLNLAEILSKEGSSKEALEEFYIAIDLKPDWMLPYLQAGKFMVGQGLWERAANLYERALEIEPDNAEAHLNLGLSHLMLDRTREAEKHMRRGVELKWDDPWGNALLGMCLVSLNQMEEAREHLEKALQKTPDMPEAHYGMGLYLARTGKKEKARAEFEFVLKHEGAPKWLKDEARMALEK